MTHHIQWVGLQKKIVNMKKTRIKKMTNDFNRKNPKTRTKNTHTQGRVQRDHS